MSNIEKIKPRLIGVYVHGYLLWKANNGRSNRLHPSVKAAYLASSRK